MNYSIFTAENVSSGWEYGKQHRMSTTECEYYTIIDMKNIEKSRVSITSKKKSQSIMNDLIHENISHLSYNLLINQQCSYVSRYYILARPVTNIIALIPLNLKSQNVNSLQCELSLYIFLSRLRFSFSLSLRSISGWYRILHKLSFFY